MWYRLMKFEVEKEILDIEALAGNGADQLAGYVAAIENIESQVNDLNAEKQRLYAEARACGFSKNAIRTLVLRRSKGASAAQHEIELLTTYEAILINRDRKRNGKE